jgi:HTH-type transcriptional regulator / antitoxin HigA
MSKAKPITTQAEYEAALARINALMGATPESPEEDELALLADLVDEYERTHPADATGVTRSVGA